MQEVWTLELWFSMSRPERGSNQERQWSTTVPVPGTDRDAVFDAVLKALRTCPYAMPEDHIQAAAEAAACGNWYFSHINRSHARSTASATFNTERKQLTQYDGPTGWNAELKVFN